MSNIKFLSTKKSSLENQTLHLPRKLAFKSHIIEILMFLHETEEFIRLFLTNLKMLKHKKYKYFLVTLCNTVLQLYLPNHILPFWHISPNIEGLDQPRLCRPLRPFCPGFWAFRPFRPELSRSALKMGSINDVVE